MRDQIVIHCSASDYGNAILVQKWRQNKESEDTDYHYVVLNGYIEPSQIKRKQPWSFLDGSVECGSAINPSPQTLPEKSPTGNPKPSPDNSLKICLIGQPGKFSLRQYYATRTVINVLCWQYDIALKNIVGHAELDNQAECPGINMKYFRQFLKDDRYVEQLIGI